MIQYSEIVICTNKILMILRDFHKKTSALEVLPNYSSRPS
jgi:hypothetical protein